jgi:hypothetical protein
MAEVYVFEAKLGAHFRMFVGGAPVPQVVVYDPPLWEGRTEAAAKAAAR